jgi:cell division protein FtsX
MATPPPPPVRYRLVELSVMVVSVVIICAGIVLAEAFGWLAIAWRDVWGIVAWIVIISAMAAAWSTWRDN